MFRRLVIQRFSLLGILSLRKDVLSVVHILFCSSIGCVDHLRVFFVYGVMESGACLFERRLFELNRGYAVFG